MQMARRVDLGKDAPYLARLIIGKLTSKAQTTIPQAVRTALGPRAGDAIARAIEDGRAVLTRFDASAADDPFATFSEWGSAANAAAYGRL